MATTTPEHPLLIDPNGDLILVVGTKEKTSLRVQSKILSVASKVFLTMFSQSYMEGMGLASASEPYSVSLPEDDPEGLTILCKLLHFQFSSFTSTPTSEELMDLAVTAHKYDCVAALSCMSTKWLLDTDFHMDEGFYPAEELLVASYLLKNHDSFKEVTKQCVYGRSCSFTAEPPDFPDSGGEVPRRLLAALEACRLDLHAHLNQKLRAIPLRVTNRSAGTATSTLTSDSQLPKCAVRRLEQFNLELIRVGLADVSCDYTTLSELIGKLRIFHIGDSALKKCSGPCKYCDYDLNSGVYALAADMEKRFDGCCLECASDQKAEWRLCEDCGFRFL